MLNEKQLRSFLISAFEHLKAQRLGLSSVIAEIASVRDALIEIGPKYADVLERHKAHHTKEFAPTLAEALQEYDEIIRQLKADGVWS